MVCARWTVSRVPLIYATAQEEITTGGDSDQLDVRENTESPAFSSFSGSQI